MASLFRGQRILTTRTTQLLSPRRNCGYVVLVPEIGEDLPDQQHPLMQANGLPEFKTATVELCIATIGKQAGVMEQCIRNLESSIRRDQISNDKLFNDVMLPLEETGNALETTWGLAKTLYLGNSTRMPTNSYLKIHERARRARSIKFNSLPIYTSVKDYLASKSEMTEEQKRLLYKFVLEGKLNGLDRDDNQRERLFECLKKIGQNRGSFKGKVDTSIQQFNHVIRDYKVVQNFPTDLLQLMSDDPLQPTQGPWKLTLHPHIIQPFLEYCPDRTLRWNVWQADVRKASSHSEKSLENSTVIEELRDLRRLQAKLLGYKTYADLSMETKMIGSVDNVKQVLNQLLEQARPSQEVEVSSLQEFASKSGFNDKLDQYDIPYWSRKQLKSKCNYDEEELREYFPMPKVFDGLFGLSEKLFNIKIIERMDVETWHDDVKYFDVFDASDGKKPIAGFYVDCYSRDNEKLRTQPSGGLMVSIRNKSQIINTTPLASLMFNFQAPIYGKPSLLTLREVQTLFKHFGHALQHLLSEATYSEVAGLSNVEWDAVDVSGHVMSHLLYDESTLKSISEHFASGEELPARLLTAIEARRTSMSGFNLCKELYLSELDMDLYTRKEFWLDIVKQLWPKYMVLPLDKKDAHPCSFTPIFSGEWAAAYYSHIWSRLVAADVYSAFHEVKTDTEAISEVGQRFRNTFLSLGGTHSTAEVFRRFRGRDPSPNALLKSLNLTKPLPPPVAPKEKQ